MTGKVFCSQSYNLGKHPAQAEGRTDGWREALGSGDFSQGPQDVAVEVEPLLVKEYSQNGCLLWFSLQLHI